MNADNTTPLAPCPFCGAPGFLVGGVTAYEVKCTDTDCTARGRECQSRLEAVAAWNRRRTPGAAPASTPIPALPPLPEGYQMMMSANPDADPAIWYDEHDMRDYANAAVRAAMGNASMASIEEGKANET